MKERNQYFFLNCTLHVANQTSYIRSIHVHRISKSKDALRWDWIKRESKGSTHQENNL